MLSIHVDTGRSWRGGQAQVRLLVRGLLRRGERAGLIVPPGSPLAERARADGLPHETLPLWGEWDLLSTLRLAQLLRAKRADVVHAHTSHALTIAGIAGMLAGTPVRIASRRVDFPVSSLGRRKLERLADRVLPVSAGIARVLEQSGVDPDHLEVVHSGIDVDAARRSLARNVVRDELGVPEGVPLIGAVGALTDHKDHASLVQAARTLKERGRVLHFVIAGEGELARALELSVTRAELGSSFRLLGFRADTPSLLAALDVFVLCSRLEGLGTSVLEAMAAGAPVVATRTGGVPEMIEDGESGLLVEPGEPELLAQAIERLLDDATLRTRLRDAASRRVEQSFSATRMIEATLAVYQAELAGKRGSGRDRDASVVRASGPGFD